MLRTLQITAVLSALLVLSACSASRRYFRPAERANAQSPEGSSAAEYELGQDGAPWGEVRVWVDEVARRDDVTTAHVGFELENVTDEPLRLDVRRLRINDLDLGDRVLGSIETGYPEPVATASPHQVHVVRLPFVLPDNVEPADVRSFNVHWWLQGPQDWTYEQHTRFVVHRPFAPRPYFRPYGFGPYFPWRPYFYPWRYGFGFGYGWCGP
ncbi:MAG: hypothetical protein AAF628_02345 [Planctomycetota bacterium]